MIDGKAILKEVQDNRSRMEGCERHYFIAPEKCVLGQYFTCENCGWKTRIVEIGHYCRGYKSAGGNPDDIFKGLVK